MPDTPSDPADTSCLGHTDTCVPVSTADRKHTFLSAPTEADMHVCLFLFPLCHCYIHNHIAPPPAALQNGSLPSTSSDWPVSGFTSSLSLSPSDGESSGTRPECLLLNPLTKKQEPLNLSLSLTFCHDPKPNPVPSELSSNVRPTASNQEPHPHPPLQAFVVKLQLQL